MDEQNVYSDATNQENPNNNVLEGKRCPRCGSYGPFEVEVTMRVLLYDEGVDDADDPGTEFDDTAFATCYKCGHAGNFGVFSDLTRRPPL